MKIIQIPHDMGGERVVALWEVEEILARLAEVEKELEKARDLLEEASNIIGADICGASLEVCGCQASVFGADVAAALALGTVKATESDSESQSSGTDATRVREE